MPRLNSCKCFLWFECKDHPSLTIIHVGRRPRCVCRSYTAKHCLFDRMEEQFGCIQSTCIPFLTPFSHKIPDAFWMSLDKYNVTISTACGALYNMPVMDAITCSVWKSSPRTGKRLQLNWTKTKQDQDQKRPFVGLLQSWSWSFHFGEIKKTI